MRAMAVFGIFKVYLVFLLSIFTFCKDGKHVSGLLFDSVPLSRSTNKNNNSASDIFQNSLISGLKDNQPLTGGMTSLAYVSRDHVISGRNNNVDSTIRRRTHRHKQSLEQIQVSKEHKVSDNLLLRQHDGDRKSSEKKIDDQMMNDDLQLPTSDDIQSDKIKNTIESMKPHDNNNNNDDDHKLNQKLKMTKQRKERMKKYWEKRKQFNDNRKKVNKEKRSRSQSTGGDEKSNLQQSNDLKNTSPVTSSVNQQPFGLDTNSIITPDGANISKWRQSAVEAKIHGIQYREHLKRQIYKSDDDNDEDETKPDHHLHHHNHHHGNNGNGRHERRCDKKICRNDGICNDNEGMTNNNVTSHKKCLCRLGTAGQYCEKTDVSVKYPKFHGYGFIAFPTMRNSYKEFSIRLEFRPEVNSGLLLFASDHVDASHDFFSVNFIDGRVEFRFDCGTGLGRIRTENQVELETWNSLEILRKETEVELRLNSGPALKGRSKGQYTKMTFRDHLFLGGHRNMTHAARYSGAKMGFVGCIRRLEVNDRKYDMRRGAFVGDALYGLDVEECDGHECERVKCHNGGTCINKEVDSYVCLCRLGNVGKNCERKADVTMPSFSDMSYLQYVGLRRTVLNFLQIEIVFLPRSDTGMLLFNGFSPDGFGDFVSLALVNSTVEFRFDLGTGPAIIKGRNSLQLNEWHTVKAWRDGKTGHLQVDGDMEVTGTSKGAFTQLTLALDLFVGGHRNFDEVTRNAFVSSSFNGCIQKLVINERPIKLIHESLGGVNIGECSAHPCSSKRPCLNGGKCIAILDKYKCDCLPGFQDDHCQERTSRYRYRYKRSSIEETNSIPKFDGNSYMLITRYDIVSKTRGSSFDLEMRIKANKDTSGLIFFVSNEIEDEMVVPTLVTATTTTTDIHTATSTTTSNPFFEIYGNNHSELYEEHDIKAILFKRADDDHYSDDVRNDVMSGDSVFQDNNLHQSIVKDDDGGYEDVNDYYHDWDGDDDHFVNEDQYESRGRRSGKDFFMAGLMDGFVTVEFSLGEGSGKLLFNKSKVDDEEWHSIRIHRRGKEATLEVDGSDVIKVTCPGSSEQLFTDGTVYIGGLPNIERRTLGRYISGFHGCIGHISLSSGQLIDLFKAADVASNVSICQNI